MESLDLQGDMEAYIEALDVLTGASSWLLPVWFPRKLTLRWARTCGFLRASFTKN